MNKAEKMFYKKISVELTDSQMEFLKETNNGFYELCRSYTYILCNALQIHNKDGSLCLYFNDLDIDIAKEATLEYIKRNNIIDELQLIYIIQQVHCYAACGNDSRQKAGNNKTEFFRQIPVVYFGDFHNLMSLPDSIFNEIKNNTTHNYIPDTERLLEGG